MTKRLISLMLALIMLLSLMLTSCSTTTEEEAEEESTTEEEVMRPNVGLTIYAVSEKKIDKAVMDAVEEKVSNYCVAKYKTSIKLQFYTEDEYENALNEQYKKFIAEAAAKEKAEAEAAAVSRSQAAERAKLKTNEEKIKFDQKIREQKRKQEEEAKKKAEAEAEKIAKGEDAVKWSEMDIIYIPNQEKYTEWIQNQKLVDLKTYLDNTYKKVRDYVYPTFMHAATVNGQVFGIPNNRGISTNETYLVLNTALVEKYNVDLSAVRSITDLEEAFAAVKAGEAGVTPIYGDFDPEGVVFYDEVDMAHSVGVFADTLVGGTKTNETLGRPLNAGAKTNVAMLEYFETKADYRAKGYLSDTNENFFVSVQELNDEQKKEWEEKGYTLHLYKGAPVTSEAMFESGLFGISSYSKYPERAMEILTLMTTDAELHNLLTFGIEEEHYIVSAENENVITRLNDDYSMNFFKTGNSLLGYVPDDMDPDYVEKAKQKNLNSFISPFFGFEMDDWTADDKHKEWVETKLPVWKAYLDPIYEQLCYGIPNWKEVLTEVYANLNTNANGMFEEITLQNFMDMCVLDDKYKSHAP